MKIILTQFEAERIIEAEVMRRVARSELRVRSTHIFTYTDGTIGIKAELEHRPIVPRKKKRT